LPGTAETFWAKLGQEVDPHEDSVVTAFSEQGAELYLQWLLKMYVELACLLALSFVVLFWNDC